jgi:lipopolysaccharide/colanic/teichoic acid biosynthesis glycosyltransferase
MQELSFMEIGKRVVDILLSLVGMAILVPLIPIIGLLIKLDSRGPVFYLADRVGKGMKPFKMYKFRTMLETPIRVGESVSPGHYVWPLPPADKNE